MKRLLLFLALLCSASITDAQNRLVLPFNMGFGVKPTTSEIKPVSYLTLQQATELFDFMKNQTGLEFAYSYGGCEDRAHAMSLFLNQRKISHYKIWNFDAYHISLFNLQQQLSAEDRTQLNARVTYGYHVAPAVIVKNNYAQDTMVIDPGISNKLITYKEWLQLQQASNSYFIFLDPEFFLFNSINGLNFNSPTGTTAIPSNFPPLLTGDFMRNDGANLTQRRVEEGLAVNEIAIKIVNELIKPTSNQQTKELLTKLVTNIDNLTSALEGSIPPDFSSIANILAPYQKEYQQRKSKWSAKLDELRNENK